MKKYLLLLTAGLLMAHSGQAQLLPRLQKTAGLPGKTEWSNRAVKTLPIARQAAAPELGTVSDFALGDASQTEADAKTLTVLQPGASSTYLNLGGAADFSYATYYPAALVSHFTGNTIKAINIKLGTGTTSVRVWIRTSLSQEPVWEYTIESVATSQRNKVISIPAEYAIDGSDLFIGYDAYGSSRFYYAKTDDSTPVSGGSLLIDQGDGYGFDDYSSSYGPLYIEAVTEGGAGLCANDITLNYVGYDRVTPGEDFSGQIVFTNFGTKPVSSVEVSYTINGTTSSDVLDISESPCPYLGSYQFQIVDSAPAQAGRYDIPVTISAVNGEADELPADNSGTCYLMSVANPAKPMAVIEEMTGMWCGWCPRGHAGIERLKEEAADIALPITVHAGDDYEAETYAPIAYNVSGYPSCLVNRATEADPFYGFNEDSYGLTELAQNIHENMPSEATVEVKAELNPATRNLEIASTTNFLIDADNKYYTIAYVLTEDNVQGEGQNNYYSAEGEYMAYLIAYYAQRGHTITIDDIREQMITTDEERALMDLPESYDPIMRDVARDIWDCYGIEGAYEGNFAAGQSKGHSYAVPYVGLNVENWDNASVSALVIDNSTGVIVNAARCKVTVPTGIDHASASSAVRLEGGKLCLNAPKGSTATLYTADGRTVSTIAVDGDATLPAQGLKGNYILRLVSKDNVSVTKLTF